MARGKDETQGRINDAAEQIGTALGRLAGRIDDWETQRDEIAAELRRYIKNAEDLLTSLSKSGAKRSGPTVQGVRRGHQRGAKVPTQERQRQHEDWAAQRKTMKLHEKGVGKKGTHAKKPVLRPITEK
jgi:hypothetical protein